MNNKEKLFELIKEAKKEFSASNKPILDIEKFVADYLDKKNAIVLPCNAGDTVYAFCDTFGVVLPYLINSVTIVYYGENGIGYHFEAICSKEDELIDDIEFENEDIGKDVFLTEDAADEKAKEILEHITGGIKWAELFP